MDMVVRREKHLCGERDTRAFRGTLLHVLERTPRIGGVWGGGRNYKQQHQPLQIEAN